MDTVSHLLFGATLAGLACLDPAVSGQPELVKSVLIASMIGSHAPDLDTVTRLKSYNHYIRYHRGITHSLPALFLWPALIAGPVSWLSGAEGAFGTLYFWTMLAVMFHVFLDLFNAYGVQCFRPFSSRWHHLDILALYDPFMFGLHLAGLILWMTTDLPPGPMFLAVYALTFLYIAARGLHHDAVIRRLRGFYASERGICHVVPGIHWFRWQFVLETDRYYYAGRIDFGTISLRDIYPKDNRHPAAEATLRTDGVKAFLHFAQKVHVRILEGQDGFEVEWRDVRFWYDHKLPFGVDVKLDRNMNVLKEQLSWRKKAWDPPYV